LGKQYEKPEWRLDETEVDGKPAAVTVRTAVHKPFCNLIHFERDISGERASDPRILLVAPLSGHHATLLRDTVRALLPEHDIYVTDWIDARMVPRSEGPFHLHDYVQYIKDF